MILKIPENWQYDGEFWMEFFTDFCREFEEVSICTLGPDFNHDGVVEAAEAVKVTFGEWLPGTDSYTYTHRVGQGVGRYARLHVLAYP